MQAETAVFHKLNQSFSTKIFVKVVVDIYNTLAQCQTALPTNLRNLWILSRWPFYLSGFVNGPLVRKRPLIVILFVDAYLLSS